MGERCDQHVVKLTTRCVSGVHRMDSNVQDGFAMNGFGKDAIMNGLRVRDKLHEQVSHEALEGHTGLDRVWGEVIVDTRIRHKQPCVESTQPGRKESRTLSKGEDMSVCVMLTVLIADLCSRSASNGHLVRCDVCPWLNGAVVRLEL